MKERADESPLTTGHPRLLPVGRPEVEGGLARHCQAAMNGLRSTAAAAAAPPPPHAHSPELARGASCQPAKQRETRGGGGAQEGGINSSANASNSSGRKRCEKGGQSENLEFRRVVMQERAHAHSIRRSSVIRIGQRNILSRTSNRKIRAVDRVHVTTPPDVCRSLPPPPQQQRTRGSSSAGVAGGTNPPSLLP
jgi:hypothetical protein